MNKVHNNKLQELSYLSELMNLQGCSCLLNIEYV